MPTREPAEWIESLNSLCLHLPIPAYQQLTHARDELRELADFSARIFDDAALNQAYNALAICLDQWADQLTQVMRSCRGPYAVEMDVARH